MLYEPEKYHIFLELSKNRWLEIESLDGVTKASIDNFLKAEEETGIKAVCFTEQSFQNGVIKDWDHSGWIK